MDALILNQDYQAQCIVDAFESFIWTERYREPGDFEIYMPVDQNVMPFFVEDYYLWRKGTKRLMIIEDLTIDTDSEIGPHVTVTGRSLESILDRRVVFYRTTINGNLQNGIEKILRENVISPSDDERRIPGVRFIHNNDPRVTSLTCDLNLLGENVLDVIVSLCEKNDLGFKIEYNEDNSSFDFMLYYGEDRSYAQDHNPWVVFSPNYDNLLSSQYYKSSKNLKTAAVIAGSDSNEYGQEVVDVNGKPELRGLARREVYIDGSDIETQNPVVNEDSIRERMELRGKTKYEIQLAIDQANADALAQTTAVYREQLRARGYEELAKTYIIESFSGEIEAVRQYIYDRDFFIGDIVQVRDEYGKEACSRITEVVMTHDVNGESLVPTFTTLIGGANVKPE